MSKVEGTLSGEAAAIVSACVLAGAFVAWQTGWGARLVEMVREHRNDGRDKFVADVCPAVDVYYKQGGGYTTMPPPLADHRSENAVALKCRYVGSAGRGTIIVAENGDMSFSTDQAEHPFVVSTKNLAPGAVIGYVNSRTDFRCDLRGGR